MLSKNVSKRFGKMSLKCQHMHSEIG